MALLTSLLLVAQGLRAQNPGTMKIEGKSVISNVCCECWVLFTGLMGREGASPGWPNMTIEAQGCPNVDSGCATAVPRQHGKMKCLQGHLALE